MSWEESKHTPRFLEIVLSVGDAMDAGSPHTQDVIISGRTT